MYCRQRCDNGYCQRTTGYADHYCRRSAHLLCRRQRYAEHRNRRQQLSVESQRLCHLRRNHVLLYRFSFRQLHCNRQQRFRLYRDQHRYHRYR